MENEKIVNATYWFKDDTINNHRLFVKSEEKEIKGIIYIPKNWEIPDRIILDRDE